MGEAQPVGGRKRPHLKCGHGLRGGEVETSHGCGKGRGGKIVQLHTCMSHQPRMGATLGMRPGLELHCKGAIKFKDANGHFFYISCKDAQEVYGRDLSVKSDPDELSELNIHDAIEFWYSGSGPVTNWRLVESCGQWHFGKVRFIADTFGFIDCEKVSLAHHKDVFIGERDIGGLSPGDQVHFVLTFTNRGDPQAKEIIPAQLSGSDVRLITDVTALESYRQRLSSHALIVIPRFFPDHGAILGSILHECSSSLQSRIGRSHEGALNPHSPTVDMICARVAHYLQMRVVNKAINHYSNGVSFRPFHRDRYRDGEKLSVIASSAAARIITFIHAANGREQDISLESGSLLVFGEGVNRDYVHGIRAMPSAGPRVSVAMWGTSVLQD